MKLEDEIDAVNDNLRPGLAGLNVRLGGLVLPYKKQTTTGGKARTVNLFVADASPASIDDQYDLDLFHIVQGQTFGKAEFTRGRIAQQVQTTSVVLIIYTNRGQAIDYLKHILAKYPKLELKALELAPDVVNDKYLFLEKQPNATTPRQLAALTYTLAAAVPVGGDYCPKFDLEIPPAPAG